MSLLHRTYKGTKRTALSRSTSDLSTGQLGVSRLIILQARFQQRQLQEKEQKLLKLYEEQQERALQRVGSRAQSGGSSVSSTSSVGAGKVRNLFQSRRGISEPRAAAVTGRDRSYPLEPITTKHTTPRTQSLDTNHNGIHKTSPWTTRTGPSFNNDLDQDDDSDFQRYLRQLDQDPRFRKAQKPSANILYFGGSHHDLRFSDELDFGQSFQVIDDHQLDDNLPLEYPRRKNNNHEQNHVDEEYFVKSFNNKRQFYENKFSGASDDDNLNESKLFKKLPNVGLSSSFRINQKAEMTTPGKYKTYVSGNSVRKNILQNGSLAVKSGLPTRQNGSTPPVREKTETRVSSSATGLNRGVVSPPARQLNGGVTSPVRKQTPIPAATPPSLQRELRKPQNPTIPEAPTEVTPPIPASRTTVSRPSSNKMSSKGQPSSNHSGSSTGTKAGATQALVGCHVCGRHFAPDRVTRHEAICKKMTSAKRRVFDATKQRVQGTDAEKYVKRGGKASAKSDKSSRGALQTNWRKQHEDFINNIRAAKEVQAHLKRGGKLKDLPPPPPSDYSDYIPCPHCGRKFNEAAAERHIPKCATMLHNKPNPNLQKKKPGLATPAQGQVPTTSIRGRK